jgi:hypothetical protein
MYLTMSTVKPDPVRIVDTVKALDKVKYYSIYAVDTVRELLCV